MRKVFALFGWAVSLIGLASCASTQNLATPADLNGEWDIIEIEGKTVVPAPDQEFPYIGFDFSTGRIHGNAGCNRLMGSFDPKAKAGTIDLGQMGTTRMMCPDMTVEQKVLAVLAQVKKYVKVDDNHMALCGKKTRRQLVVLKRKAPSATLADLEGRWAIAEAGGQAIPQGMENAPFLEFDLAAKRLHGHAGCNLINGGFQTDEAQADAIAFPQVASTMMACPDMETEGRILKALNSVKRFARLADGGMGLYDAGGQLVMVLRK